MEERKQSYSKIEQTEENKIKKKHTKNGLKNTPQIEISVSVILR